MDEILNLIESVSEGFPSYFLVPDNCLFLCNNTSHNQLPTPRSFHSDSDSDFAVIMLLSTPMGVDYVVIGYDMEVQPLVTHNAA